MATTKVKGKQVTYKAPGAGSVTRNLFDKLSELPTRADFATEQDYLNAVASVNKLGAEAVGYVPAGTGAVANTVEKQFNNREVSVFRFFTDAEIADAKSGANAVNVAAKIIQAAQYANSVNATLVFPDGDYYFNTSQSLNLADIRWRGDGDVTITFGDVALDGVAPLLGTTTVAVDAPLGALSVQLTDASLIQINAPIRLFNNSNGDTAYSYKKQGVYYVIAKSGNTVFLDRPTRFAFGAAEAGNLVQILNPDSYLGIKNIKFRKKVATGQIRACTFTFYSRVDLDDVDSINDVVASYGFGLTACAKIKINKPHTQGGTYPFLLGCCTDVKINNITGREVHHAVDFNSFCDNCVVDGFDIQSVNGGINSHPSFNVWYMNGQTSDYNTASNHRVLGGGLKNVRITVGPNANTSMLFHDAFLADATTYTRARELGLTVEYDNVTIIDQRAGDNGFFPAKGYVSMRNIVSNKSVGFGDDVLEAQTENIAHGGTWRNRRTYKVTPKSNVIDAVENAGAFEVRLRSPKLEVDNQVVRCRGDLFRAKAGEPYNFTIKVFDGWAADLNSGQLVGKLKIKAQVRHSNAGSFDYLEKEYEFYHSIPSTSGVTFPLTAIYTSGLSGVANESLAFTLSNPLQAGVTQSAISTDWFFSIDVSMSSGRTSPFYSAQYELELRNVT